MKNILISPLNWGIGHATRLIPIIKALREEAHVIIAADGSPLQLLKLEFPDLNFVEFPGYAVSYTENARTLPLKMIQELPAYLRSLKKEQLITQKLVDQYQIDGIISDNRYGLWDARIPSVLMSHQLSLHMPGYLQLFKPLSRNLLKKNIRNFKEVWVPDVADPQINLSGKLSHGHFPFPVRYIGPLSRMKKLEDVSVEKERLLVMISGPEPQRSILEKLMMEQIPSLAYKTVILGGKPGISKQSIQNSYTYFNHLNAEELNIELQKAELVVSRSGYSTIMDLAALGKKALIIPTPGQTEQEYLGKKYQQDGWYYTALQKNLQLRKDLPKALISDAPHIPPDHELMMAGIMSFLKYL